MAQFTTSAGIEDLTGKLDKSERLTMRPRHDEMVAHHAAQLFGKVDPVVGKRIAVLGNFICSVLMHE